MPGSKPGSIPKEKRDYRLTTGGPWGNISDWEDYVRVLKRNGYLIEGIVIRDETEKKEEFLRVV